MAGVGDRLDAAAAGGGGGGDDGAEVDAPPALAPRAAEAVTPHVARPPSQGHAGEAALHDGRGDRDGATGAPTNPAPGRPVVRAAHAAGRVGIRLRVRAPLVRQGAHPPLVRLAAGVLGQSGLTHKVAGARQAVVVAAGGRVLVQDGSVCSVERGEKREVSECG
jgi:hypothetical protein